MFIIKNNMDNHFINTFATRQEYEAYIASEAAMFPNYAYIEATDEVVKVMEEPQPPLAYSLILSNCNPEGDVSNICETQGFCSDSDYYVILMNGDTIATYEGQTVEYEAFGETYHPQLIDPSAGTCVWQCSAFDPSITELVCYDSDMHPIATLQTSCE